MIELYRDVPEAQVRRLEQFRQAHPPLSLLCGGQLWEVLIGGRGQALLVLPGAGGIAEHAFKLIDRLERDFKVLAPSYPPAQTTAELVAGLVTILDQQGIERAHVLGGSFGGLLAQCLVRRHPDRVASLVLSHTTLPRRELATSIRWGVRLLRWIPAAWLQAILCAKATRLVPPAHEERAFWAAFFRETIGRLPKREILSRYLCAQDLMANYAFTLLDLRGWPGSILILESDNDPMVGHKAREALRDVYPQAQVHVFYGTGHASSILRTDEYTEVVRDFLQPD
jgi:pimeloyl-ACP methyl ester carboxylesterase